MAKTSKTSGKLAIVVIILLLLVLAGSLVGNYLVYKKFDEKKKSVVTLNKEYEKVKKEYDTKLKEVTELDEELKKYENLDSQIDENKKTYFANIKKLEDEILAKKSNKKIAYLTFDDGPYYNTYKVLDILDKYNVKATFFTQSGNGQNCWDKKSANCFNLYKEYYKRGHTIANHTYYHAIWGSTYKSTTEFLTQIKNQHEHIKKQSGGYVPTIMRFPGGMNTAKRMFGTKGFVTVTSELKKMGYGWVDWTAEDGDGTGVANTDEAWSRFRGSINENIEVVLFHDYDSKTTAILPNVIEYLQKNGYSIFPLFYESNMVNKK